MRNHTPTSWRDKPAMKSAIMVSIEIWQGSANRPIITPAEARMIIFSANGRWLLLRIGKPYGSKNRHRVGCAYSVSVFKFAVRYIPDNAIGRRAKIVAKSDSVAKCPELGTSALLDYCAVGWLCNDITVQIYYWEDILLRCMMTVPECCKMICPGKL